MKKAVVTKVLTGIAESEEDYTLGFKRLQALPQRVRKNLNMSYLLASDLDITECHDYQKAFFEKLTELEFKIWLLNN